LAFFSVVFSSHFSSLIAAAENYFQFTSIRLTIHVSAVMAQSIEARYIETFSCTTKTTFT